MGVSTKFKFMVNFRNFIRLSIVLSCCLCMISCDKDGEILREDETTYEKINEYEKKILGKWHIYCEEENYSDIFEFTTEKKLYWDGGNYKWEANKSYIIFYELDDANHYIGATFEYEFISEEEMILKWIDRWDENIWEFECYRTN